MRDLTSDRVSVRRRPWHRCNRSVAPERDALLRRMARNRRIGRQCHQRDALEHKPADG